MKSDIFLFFILLTIASCRQDGIETSTQATRTDSQKKADSTVQPAAHSFIDTTDYLKLPETAVFFGQPGKDIVWLGEPHFDEKKLPELEMQKISKVEYMKYKAAYRSNMDTSHKYLAFENDSFFAFRTATEIYKLNKETNKNFGNRDGYHWSEYNGYIPELKIYVLNDGSVGENIGFSTRYLVDSTTNIKYTLESAGDGGAEIPLVSPGFSYLVSYANADYTPDCYVFAVKISRRGDRNTLKTTAFTAAGWVVKEIAWVNDNTFAIKADNPTYDRGGYPIEHLLYFRVKLP